MIFTPLQIQPFSEVYLCTKSDDPDYHRIYKYSVNDSMEGKVLSVLQDRNDIRIPKLYQHCHEDMTSPSGKLFKDLLVKEYIVGAVLAGVSSQEDQRVQYIQPSQLTLQQRKSLVTKIIKTIDLLHQHCIIFNDTFIGNCVWNDKEEVILIDFDRCFHTSQPPTYVKSIVGNNPYQCIDSFNVLSLMRYLLDYTLPCDDQWKSWKIVDVLQYV